MYIVLFNIVIIIFYVGGNEILLKFIYNFCIFVGYMWNKMLFFLYYNERGVIWDIYFFVEIIFFDYLYVKLWFVYLDVFKVCLVKMLFLFREDVENLFLIFDDEEIDVCELVIFLCFMNIMYDIVKVKVVMVECEKYVSIVFSKKILDIWEE